jgi:hypothetical protein
LSLEKISEKEEEEEEEEEEEKEQGDAFILPGKFSARRKKQERRSKGLGFRCKKKERKERRR